MSQTEKKHFSRLPKNVVPKNYKIKIIPDMVNFVFQGSQQIDVSVESPTEVIILNSKEITFRHISISTSSGVIKPSEIAVNEEDERVEIKLPHSIPIGQATLNIDFDGNINDSMSGFYKTKYTCGSGLDHHIAVTQFEASSARKAFPCWDEPAIKANFEITLVVPKDMVALSNMPVIGEKEDGCKKTVTYDKSVKMSTYLVAFAVGHFECVQDTTPNGVKVAVYTPVGRKHEGEFALKVSIKTLPFYDEFFGIPYPLPKCDLIAIPEFAAGAMENWGLVTFRETALLIDPKSSSPSGYQRVALVVGHELAHQWFGNLVTMEWWTDLWLNEGFATWVEYLCVDYCFPEYDIWTQFLNDDYSRAQTLDALKNTHPIEIPVGHPDEIDEIFDAISYSKGACVIRMLNSYMTADKFKEGLRFYLKKYKFSNAFTKDLWNSLEETSKMPISEMMSTWTKQGGFPVITVAKKKHSDGKIILHLKQEKFTADGTCDDSHSKWHVPITVVTSENPSEPAICVLMKEREMDIEVPVSCSPSWIKLNQGQCSFYRVCYSDEMMKTLIQLLSSSKQCPFTAIERHGLQSDLFWMARTGKVSTSSFLDLFQAASHEKDYTVWSDRLGNLGSMKLMLHYSKYSEQDLKSLSKLIILSVHPGYLQLKPQAHMDFMLQSMMFAVLGRADEMSIVNEARQLFYAYVKDKKPIPSHLRGAIFTVVLYHATTLDLDMAISLYELSIFPEEKIQLLRSLGISSSPEIIKKVLDYAISPKVLNQDRIFPINSVCASVVGRQMAWDFLKTHWSTIKGFYPSGGSLLCSIIGGITCHFGSEEKALEVESFFLQNPVPSADRLIKQSVENIRLTATWLKRDQEEIHQWLSEKMK